MNKTRPNRNTFLTIFRFVFWATCCIGIITSSEAQVPVVISGNGNIILSTTNAPRINDTLQLWETVYTDAGEKGIDAFWDFSQTELVDECQISFVCDSDSVVLYGLEPMRMNKTLLRNDSLMLIGYETPLMSMFYEQPVLLMQYPLSYGDSLSCNYKGNGFYCGQYILETSGTMHIVADAEGKLTLEEGDTLQNVIRVHILRSESIEKYDIEDTIRTAPDNRKQEIIEHYQWYAQGYRYPVYETVSLTCYDDMVQASCRQRAFCCMPDEQRQLQDTINEAMEEQEPIMENGSGENIINYTISVDDRIVTLQYDLIEPVNLTALICNRMGYVYRYESTTMPAGTGYSLSLDCSGLQGDVYILYLNVGGRIYSEIVNLE